MSEDLRFGIIGAGMIAEYHAQAMRAVPGVRPEGVFGVIPEQMEAFARKHQIKAYPSLEAMLADPGINAVSIATPSGHHGENSLAAARAGKHVMCEKPLEITPARAQDIIDACRTAGVILAPVFQYRYGEGAKLIREALAAGRFGRVLLSSARVKWFRPQSYYDSGAWRGTWELDGGGCLMNQSIHAIDLMIHFGGVPSEVYGAVATLTHKIEVEDNAVALVKFADGVAGTIESSTSCEPGFPPEVQVSGEKGTATLAGDRLVGWNFGDRHPLDGRVATLSTGMGDGGKDPKAISITGHIQVIEGLLGAVRGDRSGLVDPLEARYPLDVICGIYESARLGRPVPLPWQGLAQK
ncbi:MAG: Gfo/Idh/MocA family oxidoreductase [Planctomycetota bacterium]|nr:Gfo/Idh/MocA family oxidoreductase [Planctomycetota bacterium]